jgi:hypothetical protein
MNSAARMNLSWEHRAKVNGWEVRRSFLNAAPGGRTVAAEYAVSLTNRQVMIAGAQHLASRLTLPLAVATTAYSIYDAIRTRPDGDGGLGHDPGQAPNMVPSYCVPGPLYLSGVAVIPPAVCGQSLTDIAAEIDVKARARGCTSDGQCWWAIYQAPHVYVLQCFNWTRSCASPVYSQMPLNTGQPAPQCPGYFDNFEGVYVQAGASSPGWDGKCRVGAYTVPMTPEEAADMRSNNGLPPLTPDQWEDMMNDVLGREPANGFPGGLGVQPDFEQETRNFPPSLTGGTTRTTHPDGSYTDTISGWDLATDAQRKRDVRYLPKTTTQNYTADGQPSGAPTTTTTDNGGADDPTDPCTANPERLGCVKLGELPTDEVPKTTRTISYTAEALGLPAGCPNPIPLAQGHQLSYQATCDAFTTARPVVLVVAAFSAMLIVVFALRAQ